MTDNVGIGGGRRGCDKDEAHAAYGTDGIRLAFGRAWDDSIVHVASVASGAACGCRCPACGSALVARKGERSRHHFSHAPDPGRMAEGRPCDGGHMTALHRYARDLIAARLELTTPPVGAGDGDERIVRFPAKVVRFDSSETERAVPGGIGDVVLDLGGAKVCVEIRVTHETDDAKTLAMRAAGHAMLEIDLRTLPRDLDGPGFDAEILHRASRRWLSNRHLDALEAELAAMRERRASIEPETRSAAARNLASLYAAAEVAALSHDPGCDTYASLIRERGWSNLASGFDALAPGFFTVHADQWRAAVLVRLLGERSVITAAGLAASLRVNDQVHRELQSLVTSDPGLASEAGLPAIGAEACVEHYLDQLASTRVAERHGSGWVKTPGLGARMAERLEGHYRIRNLCRLVEEIGRELPPGLANDFLELEGDWRVRPLEGQTASPLEIAEDGGPIWFELERQLQTIVIHMKQKMNWPPEDLGLPLVGEAIRESIERRRERGAYKRSAEGRSAAAIAERDRLERRQAGRRRLEILREAADAVLGDGAPSWVAGWNGELAGHSGDVAQASEEGLTNALASLRRLVARESGRRK